MPRCFLFVPATDSKRLARAHERGAGAIILDLEDTVPPDAKDAARACVGAAAAGLTAAGARVWVRINGAGFGAAEDLAALAGGAIEGVVAPKIACADDALAVAQLLREAERAAGVDPGRTQLIALIESARGVLDAPAIAATPDVSALAFGSEDFAADIGAAADEEALDLPVRQLVLAAAAARKRAYAAPVSIAEYRDLDRYRAGLRKARRIGAAGVFCIHPAQVEVANDVFRPSAAELERARAVLAAWEEALHQGKAVTALNGLMIDAPVAARARSLLGEA